MIITLTDFAKERHFDPSRAGTVITNIKPEQFEQEFQSKTCLFKQGYAPFCRLAFTHNWTNAKTGTIKISPENEKYLKSDYLTRTYNELPVLTRWIECEAPKANTLCVVMYDKEQLNKEEINIGSADYGIVAILGQMNNKEEPINPMTMIRNALGIEEGGSGVPLNKEKYLQSVEFWKQNAVVKNQINS